MYGSDTDLYDRAYRSVHRAVYGLLALAVLHAAKHRFAGCDAPQDVPKRTL